MSVHFSNLHNRALHRGLTKEKNVFFISFIYLDLDQHWFESKDLELKEMLSSVRNVCINSEQNSVLLIQKSSE